MIEYSDVDAQMNSRFRFAPPNEMLAAAKASVCPAARRTNGFASCGQAE